MTTRAAQKKAARKARMEKITFGRKEDPDGAVGIPRYKLTPEHVNNVFNVEVEYVVDEHGNVTYPERFMWECMPLPFRYFIVEKELIEPPPDDGQDPYYMGETQVVLWNVPTTVDETALRLWIEKGLERTDDRYMELETQLHKLQEKLTRCKERLENVPYMVVDAITEKGEAEERRQIGKRLELEQRELEAEIKDVEKAFEKERQRREGKSVDLERQSLDEKRKVSTWYASFDTNQRARRAVTFQEWKKVNLALGFKSKKEQLEPVASWGELPKDRIQDEVNMCGVVLQRLRHGKGTYTDWRFGDVYQGDFFHGKRHGEGRVYDRIGVYRGEFRNDFQFGKGVQAFANGDKYDGPFGFDLAHLRISRLEGEAFHMGALHGQGARYEFANGAVYEGEFKDGEITGQGVYWDPGTGERMEGTFRGGLLHGKGFHITRTGERLEGMFRDGQLHGSGSWESKPRKYKNALEARGGRAEQDDMAAGSDRDDVGEEDEYTRLDNKADTPFRDRNKCVGTFSNGQPHGKCVYTYRKGHTYRGYYVDGARSGPGALLYGNVSQHFDKGTGRTYLKYDYEYQGLWLANRIRQRGCHVTVYDRFNECEKMAMKDVKGLAIEHRDSYTYTTNSKSWAQYPFLHRMVFKQEGRARRQFTCQIKWEKKQAKARKDLWAAKYKEFREQRRKTIAIYKQIDRKLQVFHDPDMLQILESGEDDFEEEEEEEEENKEVWDDDDDDDEDEENEEEMGGGPEDEQEDRYYDSDWESVSGTAINKHEKVNVRQFFEKNQHLKELKVTLIDVIENPPPKDEKTGMTSISKALEHFSYDYMRKKLGLR